LADVKAPQFLPALPEKPSFLRHLDIDRRSAAGFVTAFRTFAQRPRMSSIRALSFCT
jgi:hypothetical protein